MEAATHFPSKICETSQHCVYLVLDFIGVDLTSIAFAFLQKK